MYADKKGREYSIRSIVRDFETGEEFVIFSPTDYDAFYYDDYILRKSRFDELMTECKTQRTSYHF